MDAVKPGARDAGCPLRETVTVAGGGVLLLPDQPTSTPHLLVEAGKQGMVYVVNRDQFTNPMNTHYIGTSGCTSIDPEILEESPAVGGSFSGPSYWNNNIYFWGSGDVLKSIPIANGQPDFTHISSSTTQLSFPGGSTAVSSNGTTAGTAGIHDLRLWRQRHGGHGAGLRSKPIPDQARGFPAVEAGCAGHTDPNEGECMSARILVVDDEPDLEELITQRFRREIRDGSKSFAFARPSP